MRNCLVIGDAIIDVDIIGSVSRISPEGPFPVVDIDPNKEKRTLGAAANVAKHLANYGLKTHLMFKTHENDNGEDIHNSYYEIISECNRIGIDCLPLVIDKRHPITTKTRIWAENKQMLRIDVEDRNPPNKDIEHEWIVKIINFIRESEIDIVAFVDYNKGTLTNSIIQNVAHYCHHNGVKTLLDPKRPDFQKLKNLTVIKPNHKEVALTNMDAETISEYIGQTYLINTRGKDGYVIYRDGIKIDGAPSLRPEEDIKDSIGAGDSYMSGLIVGLANNLDIQTSAKLANMAASFNVRNYGTYALTGQEMKECLKYAIGDCNINYK